MTTHHQVLEISKTVDAADLAIPADFKRRTDGDVPTRKAVVPLPRYLRRSDRTSAAITCSARSCRGDPRGEIRVAEVAA